MRAVIQRATSGEVRVEGRVVGRLVFDPVDEARAGCAGPASSGGARGRGARGRGRGQVAGAEAGARHELSTGISGSLTQKSHVISLGQFSTSLTNVAIATTVFQNLKG